MFPLSLTVQVEDDKNRQLGFGKGRLIDMVFLSLSIHIVMSFKRALNESATPRFQAVFLFQL